MPYYEGRGPVEDDGALGSKTLLLEFAGHLTSARWHKRMIVIFEAMQRE